MAFHGLGVGPARRLAQSDFGARLSGSNPAVTVAQAGRLIRYVGVRRAFVRAPNRRVKIITSSVPLRASTGDGTMRPVDLTLRPRGAAFTAANPAQPVSVSRRLDGGVAVGRTGLRVIPLGANVSGTVEPGGQSVFFAGTGLDEDVSVASTIDGAELSAVLRSGLSPEQIAYRVILPLGATLAEQDGGAVVERAGRVLAAIPAPTVIDAQSSFVPATMHVAHDELLLNIAHRSRDVAYPLLVDPRIIVVPQSPGWHFHSCDPCEGNDYNSGPQIEGPKPGVLVSPSGAHYGRGEIKTWKPGEQYCQEKKLEEPGLVYCFSVFGEAEYHPNGRWEWFWPNNQNRSRYLKEVSYYGVHITPNVPTTESEQYAYSAGTGSWSYKVGCRGGYNYEAPPTKVTGCGEIPNVELSLYRAPTRFVYWDEGHKFSTRNMETSAETKLSVEAVVVTEETRLHRRHGRRKSEYYGPFNEGQPNRRDPCALDPVDCATGNLTETQTDVKVPGRGVGLTLARTYNAQAAASQYSPGAFGYGWSWTFGAHLTNYGVEGGERQVVEQSNGSTVTFTKTSGQTTTAPGTQATLSGYTNGLWTYTLPSQNVLKFNGSGNLVSEADRNGNLTTVGESCSGNCRIEVTDPAGRKLTLDKNSEGLVERATDPMGHTVTYGYENGNLVSVTEPGEATPRWRFHYDSQHRMTGILDGRGGTTTNEYDSQSRVVKQKDRRNDTHTFEYRETGGEQLQGALSVASETPEEEHFLTEMTAEEEAIMAEGYGVIEEHPYTPPEYVTEIKDNGTGAVALEHFGSENALSTITSGAGTPQATTRSFAYDGQGNTTSETNGANHETKDTYDAEGNKTSETDPLGHKAEWKYDSTHDVIMQTTPRGETTTIHRDEHGNALEVTRPAPGGETQTTKYGYNSFGELTGMTNPLNHTWRYEYNSDGDRITEIAPEGGKHTFAYNLDSQEISMTSPRGNVAGGEPARFTTIIERDAQGRVVRVTEPLE